MKYLAALLSLIVNPNCWSQVFHFEDTSATINVSTTQSPAHWYLEIINETNVDTTLRWIANFENIPAEWEMEFNVQNQNWPVLLDGDSSDFVAFVTEQFPQKLIIGATTNQTIGHGSVFFQIFDPANRSFIQTIEYEFIVGSAGLAELELLEFLKLENGVLWVTNGKPTQLSIYDLQGKLIQTESSSFSFQTANWPKNEPFLIHLKQENKQVVLKLFQE